MTKKTKLIREQNDIFRKSIPSPCAVPGRLLITQGVQALYNEGDEPNKNLAELLQILREHNDFDKGNDPYKEHDFGHFTFKDESCYWKFDYYANDLLHGSDDPSDLSKTMRVLTIMRVEEY